ncbi:MAG TPA: hypothetical protein VK191_05200 [Symbiobacteriaceae bacterium]|nr:hypothetical protein [Symbiobacteriaceae bacterium]
MPQKKRPPFGRIFVGGLAWLALMGSAFLLVERQTAIQRELDKMTKLTAQEQLLDQETREAVGRKVTETSVGEIEAWATAHGMVRPTAVKALEADPKAVVNRPQSEAKPVATAPEGGLVATARTLLQTLFAPLSAKGK